MSYVFPTIEPPLISNPFSPFLSRLGIPARHGLLNTCCIGFAYMQMVANAGLVILEPFLESEYYGVTPRIRGAYVPQFSNVTASVAAFDKQMAVNARGVMLCYKYAAKQMIAQGRGGRIIGAYLVSNVCAWTLAKLTRHLFSLGASSMAGKQGTHDPPPLLCTPTCLGRLY